MLLIALAAAAVPTLGCEDRITGAFTQFADGRRVADTFAFDRRRDFVAGPLAMRGLRGMTPRDWDSMAARDQWLKSPLVMRPGRAATIEVPPDQRSWMKIVRGSGERLRLRACARGGRSSGSSGNTAWSGGFEIDYARAPQQGRCARIVVRVAGRDEPIRRRLTPRAGPCD